MTEGIDNIVNKSKQCTQCFTVNEYDKTNCINCDATLNESGDEY